MLDVQRERLRHLLANAILELWKKETGSLTSVLIEGTICITSSSGKTTVVQVADKFSGGIPDSFGCHSEDSGLSPDLSRSFNLGNAKSGRDGSAKLPDQHLLHMPYLPIKADLNSSPTALAAAYLDQMTAVSATPPSVHLIRNDKTQDLKQSDSQTPFRPKQETPPNQEQPMETSTSRVLQDDAGSEGSAEGGVEGQERKSSSSAGPVCPGTGYYTCAQSPRGNQNSDSSDEDCDSDMEDLPSFEGNNLPTTSTPKGGARNMATKECNTSAAVSPVKVEEKDESSQSKGDQEEEDDKGSDDALDLSSRKDADLALSSPQSYTAQVRDVIRQRLLASKGVSEPPQPRSGASSPSPAEGERPRPLTPPAYMLSNFSTHRRSFSHSWPGARDKPNYGSHLFSPGSRIPPHVNFSSPLSVGLPNGPSMAHPSSASPTLIPGMFPFPPRAGFPPGGAVGPLHDILSLGGKPPLPSPSQTSSSGSPDDNTHPVFPSPSPTGKSSPDPTDVNGNTEKDPVTGEQKVYKCEFCNKTFLFKSKYHEHLPVHTNARPFQCHMCSRTYKYKYDLRVHLRTHMGIPTKSTVCPFCSSKFSTNKILRIHIKDAHRDRQRSMEESATTPTPETNSIPAAAATV